MSLPGLGGVPQLLDEVPAEVEREVVAGSVEIDANAHDCIIAVGGRAPAWKTPSDDTPVG
jgi:hypothetical protein